MEIKVGEIWKDIRGYESLYQVSNLGRVKSIPREGTKGGFLKPSISKSGYLCVTLSKNNKTKRFPIHRLVANNFLEVNHKDGNKLNNKLNNLEFVTKSQNILHRFRVLKQKPYRKYNGIKWDTKQGINEYHRMYYKLNKEKILKYQKERRKTILTHEVFEANAYKVKGEGEW